MFRHNTSSADGLDADAVLYGTLRPWAADRKIHDQKLLAEAERRLENLDQEPRSFLKEMAEQDRPMTFSELDHLINGPRDKHSWEEHSVTLVWQEHIGPILKKLILTGMVDNYDDTSHQHSRWILTERGRAAAQLLGDHPDTARSNSVDGVDR